MGGIGKTTLARYAYDDPLITYHFDVHAWVTVSQDYSIDKILFDILYSMDRTIKQLSREELQEHLYKFLKGRRYIIVMDDLWDVNVWDAVRQAFPDDSNGSRIMITSRHLDVVSYIDPSNHPHQMNLMDTDQGWNLLREKVFAQEHCPFELEQIGRVIVEKCRGLPLAILVIAGILRKDKQMKGTWQSIERNVIEAVNSSDERFNEILSLSYKHLPLHVRPCFLYMGGFPEDHEINVSKLVKLWVAEGLLKLDTSKNEEEVAEEYLEDLTNRSLVMVSKKRYDGKTKTMKIHDLLRDFCLRKAQDEKFVQVISKFTLSLPDVILNSRRLSVFMSDFSDGILNLDRICSFVPIMGYSLDTSDSPIHTILRFVPGFWDINTWVYFKLLRILDAPTVIFSSFDEICKLIHLRYLSATFRPVGTFMVPCSLYKLRNLQTLIITPYSSERGALNARFLLPFGIWRLPQLRHLIVFNLILLDICAGALTIVENLRTLSRVTWFTCSKRLLKLLPNLNKLSILYFFRDIFRRGWSRYRLVNLIHFHVLEKLNLCAERVPWDGDFPYENYSSIRLQKSDIAFPVSLKKLTLSGCRLLWYDMTIVGSLPNLEVLKLRMDACYGDNWETTEGEFCQLKVLVIEKSDPREWITDSSHFPRLQRLLLSSCYKLEKIPVSIGEIPTLQLIELDRCRPSMVKSARCIEEEQRSTGNDDLQVRILHRREAEQWYSSAETFTNMLERDELSINKDLLIPV